MVLFWSYTRNVNWNLSKCMLDSQLLFKELWLVAAYFFFFNPAVTSLNNISLLDKGFKYSSLNEFQQLKKWYFKKNLSFYIMKKKNPRQFSAWKMFSFLLSEESSVEWRYFVVLYAELVIVFVYLDASLKTVLYVLARGIIRKQCKSWLSWFPHPCILVQGVQKFLHCGRGIKPNNLKSSQNVFCYQTYNTPLP